MKKTDFILIGLVLVVVLVGVLSNKGTKAESEIVFPLELTGEVGLNEITYDEYEDMVKNNKPFIVNWMLILSNVYANNGGSC